jgi:hypothetical protein
MTKIFKLNATGTLGVVINKQMKAAGYELGKDTVWEAATGGFILRVVQKPIASAAASEAPPAQPQA